MTIQPMVVCRMCGKVVPGIATDHGLVAAPHEKIPEGINCPGGNCPGDDRPPKQENDGENRD